MYNPVSIVQLSLLFSPGIWLPTPFSSCQCPHPFRNLISLVSSRIPLSSFRRVTISMSLNKFLTIIFFCLKFFLLTSLRFMELVLRIHMQYFMSSTCSTEFGFNLHKRSKYSQIMIIWMQATTNLVTDQFLFSVKIRSYTKLLRKGCNSFWTERLSLVVLNSAWIAVY